MTGYQCVRCDAVQDEAWQGCACPACGGNLRVLYDYATLRTRAAAGELFGPPGSGILRFRSLLPLADARANLHLHVGDTPLYKAERLGKTSGLAHLYFKDDTVNPSASFKDRAGAIALLRARETGADVMACASTGNAGSSLACLAASENMPCVVFVPTTAPTPKLTQLLAFGATVLAVDGTYDDAFDLCAATCRQRGWFNRNTGTNPFTREGKKTCSFELWEQLGGRLPDWIVVPTGDGNILSGIWKGLQELQALGLADRLPRLMCAQSELSAAVSHAVQAVQDSHPPGSPVNWTAVDIAAVQATTRADSICVNDPRDGLAAVRAVVESSGRAVTVPDDALFAAAMELAAGTGLFAEPAAAAPWACLKQAVAAGQVGADDTIVCLVTGSGLKDVAALQGAVGRPIHVAPTLQAVEAALG